MVRWVPSHDVESEPRKASREITYLSYKRTKPNNIFPTIITDALGQRTVASNNKRIINKIIKK